MARVPIIVAALILLTLSGLGLWAWWIMPAAFVDSVKHVASTRPVDQAVETTSLVSAVIPLAEDLSQRTGSDWPAFPGPTGNGQVADVEISPWPASGPKVAWSSDIGEGYAAPAIVRGRALLFDRVGERVRCRCLHSETGKDLWQFSYPTDYRDKQGYDGGPRASPVSDGSRVYLYGPEGMLHCLRLSDGSLLWKIDTLATFGVVQNIFGVGSTPLLVEDQVLVQVGGSPAGSSDKDFMNLRSSGSCIVAFDKFSGKVLYQGGQELASYASPQVVSLHSRQMGLVFARGGIVCFDPASGSQLFRHPFRARSYNSVNASNLIMHEEKLFVTEAYEVGCGLYEWKTDGLNKIWSANPRQRDKGVCCHWSTPVLVNGNIYGCTSRHRNDAEVRCVDWATGNVMWTARPTLKEELAGRGSFIAAKGTLLYFVEEGWLFLIKAQASGYEQLAAWDATAVVPKLKHPCWTGPVLARGMLYLRGKGCLVCVEMTP